MTSSGLLFRYLCFLFLLLSSSAHSAQSQTIEVDYQLTHQTIEAFGASDAWAIDPAIRKWRQQNNSGAITHLADLLFDTETGIGLSGWRFNIGAGSAGQGEHSQIPDPFRRVELLVAQPGGKVDPSKQLGQVRFLREAHHRGVDTFVAFANSPPHWATKNGLTHPADGEGVGSSNLDPSQRDDFSRFLVQVLEYLRGDAVGVPVNYISPANEPTWHWQDQTQEGNRYNNDDLKKLYRSLHGALQAAGLEHSVEIDGPEAPEYRVALDDDLHRNLFGDVYREGMSKTNHGEFKNYFQAFLADAEMQAILGNKASLHSYFSEASGKHLGPLRDAMVQNLQRISPLPRLWMSEYCVLGDAGDIRDFDGHGFNADDFHVAEHIARIIHRDLTRLNVTAWFWWLALTPYDYKDGLIRIAPDLDAASVQASKVFWVLGQYSRFIRPGYQRLSVPGYDDLQGLMASAYRSPEGDRLVVVAINAGEQGRTLSLAYKGLPEGVSVNHLQAFKTDAQANLAFSPTLLEKQGHIKVPAHSVVTLTIDLIADAS